MSLAIWQPEYYTLLKQLLRGLGIAPRLLGDPTDFRGSQRDFVIPFLYVALEDSNYLGDCVRTKCDLNWAQTRSYARLDTEFLRFSVRYSDDLFDSATKLPVAKWK